MSSPETPDVSSQSNDVEVLSFGRVKWFNNKAGYGFVTVSSGEQEGQDVFVHHSAINVAEEQYRYLIQGEYVQFKLCSVNNSNHKWQAGAVHGINNGKLMCETRLESRDTRNPRDDHMETDRPTNRPAGRHVGRDDGSNTHYRVRTRGPGPREGEEWMLVRRKVSNSPHTNSPQREVLRSRQTKVPSRDVD